MLGREAVRIAAPQMPRDCPDVASKLDILALKTSHD